ncbi:MAG TPA: amidohydrolase family protein [Euzebyales bacterium]|nr:amidohydrolase family protein [Euzebyales bacterium]
MTDADAGVAGPAGDAEVAEFWRTLGLPGAVDLHVHFMPDRVLCKVWAFFDGVRLRDGTPWHVTYRLDQDARVARLRALGVTRFGALAYAHRPGMAEWLNIWSADFAAAVPDAVHCATFHDEPEADAYVAAALEAGAALFKVHLRVGGFDPRDPQLRPVWARLAAAEVPVIVHAGSGPRPGAHTGPDVFGEVLAAHPRLTAVIAHMGMPEYGPFLDLAVRYPNVHLDTTMVFTDFVERFAPYPRALVPRLAEHADRIVLGSDFPNIPYHYAHQIDVLARVGLGADWLRRVCWHNPQRLLAAVRTAADRAVTRGSVPPGAGGQPGGRRPRR